MNFLLTLERSLQTAGSFAGQIHFAQDEDGLGVGSELL